MWKYTVKVDGMMCGMCEAHMNDAVRKAMKVKKVTSSHTKGETEIIMEDEMDEAVLAKTVKELGYTLGDITKEEYKKKGLLKWF